MLDRASESCSLAFLKPKKAAPPRSRGTISAARGVGHRPMNENNGGTATCSRESWRVPGELVGESRRASSGGWHRFQDGSRASSGGATVLPRRLCRQRESPCSRESPPARERR